LVLRPGERDGDELVLGQHQEQPRSLRLLRAGHSSHRPAEHLGAGKRIHAWLHIRERTTDDHTLCSHTTYTQTYTHAHNVHTHTQYNIPPNTRVTTNVTQCVVEFEQQYYSPSDLTLFFEQMGLPTNTPVTVVGTVLSLSLSLFVLLRFSSRGLSGDVCRVRACDWIVRPQLPGSAWR
jgi:hypothetical protein